MNKKLNLLHVEDSPRDASLLRRHLTQAGYELTMERVETADSMRAALEDRSWDLIICDYSMPHFSGLRALALLQEMGLDIPFIIISGTVGEELAVQAMLAGASDYLMKGNLTRLVPTIERELQEAANRRARARAELGLRASEAQYRMLLDTAYEGVWISNTEAKTTYVNQRMAEMIGLEPRDMVGRFSWDFVADESRAEVEARWTRRNRGVRDQYDLCLRHRDGSSVWTIVSATPVFGDQGEFAGSLCMLTDITTRRTAEQQVRLQAAALRSAANAISITDTQGNISWINPAFTLLTGYPESEAIGRNARILNSRTHDRTFFEKMWQTILAGEVWRGEVVNRRRDGSLYLEEQTITPVIDDEGHITNFIAVKQDITERNRIEQELKRSEEKYRELIENAHDVIYTHDLEGNYTSVNQAGERITGYTREEALSMNLAHTVAPEYVALAREMTARKLAGESITSYELEIIARDGGRTPLEVITRVIMEDGKPVGIQGIARDVTARRRAEAALRESEDRYRDLIEHSTDLICTHTLDGRILSVNHAAIKLLEIEPEGLIGSDMRVFLVPEARGGFNDYIAELTKNGVAQGTVAVRTRTGEVRLWEYANSLRTEGSPYPIVRGMAQDVTERRAVEKALRSSEEQLRQAQKMEAIGQLAGGVAHDFNNLLTVISGYTDLTARKLRSEDPIRQNLNEIKRASERAAGLTRQLLAFSRKQVLQPRVLSLNSVVSELEKMLHRLIGEDVDLGTMLGPELGLVKADPGQIEQVIMNLVVNARDAMPGGGRLTIETANIYLTEDYATTHVSVVPGPYVMLAVTDTGVGMDLTTQTRVFEPFFTTKAAGHGTGLGLSTVYGIVKQSGGYVWLYSEVGVGTTFKIYLPRITEDAKQYAKPTEENEQLGGTDTLLLVEDDDMLRRLSVEVLESYGYKVLSAANGGSALLLCESHPGPIHMLVTDVVMPEMNGREAAERLLKIRPDMKVLFMSGYTDNTIVHQGVLDDGANFLQKPFSPEALARKVRQVLDSD